MSLYRLRVYWEEDDLVYRDIEVASTQTLMDFNKAIIKAWEFDGKHASSFFESNDHWNRGREFSSEVLSNKKDAPALSMIKTPLSALIATPNQKFVYEYDPIKHWTFLVELIGVSKDMDSAKEYPLLIRKEGIGPAQYGVKGLPGEKMVEEEEAYDLDDEERAEGFSDEGEEELGGGDEQYGDE
ncbi:MAG: hypothetical protein JST36_00215 [Bacteroidetes bacterium]|nr:hypothetical protein [Bacteroidota bacterium]